MAESPTTKRCIECGKTKDIPDDFYVKEVREHSTRYHSRCKPCFSAHTHRAGPKEKRIIGLKKILSPEMLKARVSARRAVWNAVYRGTLVKPASCSDCGKPVPKIDLEAHHEDYKKPLDVTWLCRTCHRAADSC